MPINFPDSPAENDSFTSGGKKWIFNGTVWTLVTANSYTIPTGEVTTAKILDANVTAAKLASGAAVANIGYTPANIASPTFTGTVVLPSTTSIGTVSNTEIGYVDGVTSAIQTQLDSKLTATTATTSGRNLLINGDFKVWQRGTAVQSNAGQGAYAADRWCGAHQFQNSRTQRTSISSPPSGLLSQYALRSSSSTTAQVANGTRMRIVQKVESLNSYRLRGEQVTLSFWVRFSSATISSVNNTAGGGSSAYGNFGYSIGSYTSTTDSATNTSAADTATNGTVTNGSLPTTWTKYTLTGTISSTANNVDVVFGFSTLGSTTSADTEWFELAQIQLEVGAVATPFEFEDYGVTLAKCQRYYSKVASALYTTGRGVSGTGRNGLIHDFPVRMRAAATVLGYKDGAGTASRATYHSANFGNGANHGLTINYAVASDSRCFILTDSYSGFDFYIQDLELGAEL